jgi:uncharacterized protein YcgI (DUF1989 family)
MSTGTRDVLTEETIAPGGYWTRTLDRWQRLRIVDVDGRQACSLLAYNADQPSERFNAPDTVKIQNQIFLTTGRVLFSDLGRVLFSIVDDTTTRSRDSATVTSTRHGTARAPGPTAICATTSSATHATTS